MSEHVTLLQDLRAGKDCNLEAVAAIEDLEQRLAAAEADAERMRKLFTDLEQAWNRRGCRAQGSPNHCHEVPGIWDGDNGDLAGKPCAECALYDEARKYAAIDAARGAK